MKINSKQIDIGCFNLSSIHFFPLSLSSFDAPFPHVIFLLCYQQDEDGDYMTENWRQDHDETGE